MIHYKRVALCRDTSHSAELIVPAAGTQPASVRFVRGHRTRSQVALSLFADFAPIFAAFIAFWKIDERTWTTLVIGSIFAANFTRVLVDARARDEVSAPAHITVNSTFVARDAETAETADIQD